MNRKFKPIFYVFILLSCFSMISALHILCRDNIEFPYNIKNILKYYFLYYSNESDFFYFIRIQNLIVYYSALLFGYFIITISLFGASRKYREMVILRYGTKPKFLAVHCRKGLINSGLVVLVFSISLLVAGYFYNHSLQINNSDILQLLLRFANLFLFYNILVLVNIFCLLFTHDWVSIVAGGSIIGIVLIADIYIPFISFLTYGEISSEITSICIQAFIYLLGFVFLRHRMKYAEL